MAPERPTPRSEQKRKLEDDYEQKLQELMETIETLQQAEQETLAQTRSSQVTRLQTLIDRKHEIETEIMQHTSELHDAYLQAKSEMEIVLQGRLEDLVEAEKGLMGQSDGVQVDGLRGGKGKENLERVVGGDEATEGTPGVDEV